MELKEQEHQQRGRIQLLRTGGIVPVGNRLLIQTSAFLYCIGER
jgi:hypothetical protein